LDAAAFGSARAAHDVATVADQKMQASSDAALIDVCTAEIAVCYPRSGFRRPDQVSAGALCGNRDPALAGDHHRVWSRCTGPDPCGALATSDPVGKLWVVEPGTRAPAHP